MKIKSSLILQFKDILGFLARFFGLGGVKEELVVVPPVAKKVAEVVEEAPRMSPAEKLLDDVIARSGPMLAEVARQNRLGFELDEDVKAVSITVEDLTVKTRLQVAQAEWGDRAQFPPTPRIDTSGMAATASTA